MATTTQASKGSILITGASGGIGTATARHLDAEGFRVFAGVRKSSDGEKLQREISARITPVLLDVTDPASIAEAAKTVSEALGSAELVGLVNSAGLIVEGPIELLPLEAIRHEFEVHVIGRIAVIQAFLPLLRRARGRIVNMGAMSGRIALPFIGVLSASNAAQEFLTDALRLELRPWGIFVAIVEPMAIETTIFEKAALNTQQATQQWSDQPQGRLYTSALAEFRKAFPGAYRNPPDVVVAAITHALTAHRPRTRYPVGRMARQLDLLRLLPDRMRDSQILKTLGLTTL
jgi:NAD(P)-dependent dehydrogenase (short-subunit alcohol dehydrogenase family)